MLKIHCFVFAFLLVAVNSFGQTELAIEMYAKTPKVFKQFPLFYKLNLPRTEFNYWDADFNKFETFLTASLLKTQVPMRFKKDEVVMMMNPNSIMPHAQLDTLTKIIQKEDVNGAWRMLSYRSLRITDSVAYHLRKIYRVDTLLGNHSADDVFAIFKGNNFYLHAKEAGRSKFKLVKHSRYSIENNRYLMLYKLIKSNAGVLQIGIDEEGQLILHFPVVIERRKEGEYVVFIARIEQLIFEKIRLN